MLLEEYLELIRADKVKEMGQLTLGQIIEKLTPIASSQHTRKEEAKVMFDFEYLFPVSVHSWRGAYDELAIDFAVTGESTVDPYTVSQFLEIMKQCVGRTFHGYKGGEFIMRETTPVWVAKHNHSGNTAVLEIVDQGYQVLIMTGYREY